MKKLEEKFIEILEEQELNGAKETIKQCAELTEQECIGFAKFTSQNGWYYDPAIIFWWNMHDKLNRMTDSDLFQLYLKSK